MNDAPEKIIAFDDGNSFAPNIWIKFTEREHAGEEYIRADLVPQWLPIETVDPKQDEAILVYGEGYQAVVRKGFYKNE